jgi:hypothetical protein
MRRCGHLVMANGNGRHLHQSNTLGPWTRNSSRHADEVGVRNLAGYSRRKGNVECLLVRSFVVSV